MKPEIREAISWLESTSVRFRPKSTDVYDKVLGFAQAFEQLPDDMKEEVRSSSKDAIYKKLYAFSGFFAEMALNTRDSKWIRAAVVLHLIEDFRNDYRENMRYLALISFAARKLGLSLADVLSEVSSSSSDKAKNHFVNYIHLSLGRNELSDVGMRADVVDGVYRFVQI